MTTSGPGRWGIGGFSDGGTCALVLGLRHPDLYGTIIDYSGDLGPNTNGNTARYIDRFLAGNPDLYPAHDPTSLLAAHPYPATTALWLEAGTDEPRKQADLVRIAAIARTNNITVELVTKPGRHNFTFWRQCVTDTPDWIGHHLGLTTG